MQFLPWQLQEPQSIYLHIPYCLKRCPYCDFVSFAIAQAEVPVEEYIELLCREISQSLLCETSVPIKTIYFGGGTPSLIPNKLLIKLLQEIKKHRRIAPDCEITLEMNPGTLEYQDLPALAKAGFNRLSIGLQTSDNQRLKNLGRIHSREAFLKCLASAKAAGFKNISVDLMSALPYETIENVEEDLSFVLSLDVPHISTYSLIIEEGTPFGELYSEGEDPLPSPDTERQMYHLIRSRLIQAGYRHYEISNFSLPGFESRHNRAYWLGDPYYGFGLSASSYVKGARRTNPSTFSEYKELVDSGIHVPVDEWISPAEARKEFFIFRLRLAEGFSESEFTERFGESIPSDVIEILEGFRAKGYLHAEEGRWFYTELGLDFADAVARELV